MNTFRQFLLRRIHSVSFYIFLALMVLVLPLNFLFLDSARRSSNALLSQVEYTLDNIGSIYVQTLESRIDLTSSYLTDVLSDSTYFQTVAHQNGDEQYTLCKYFLAQELIERSNRQNEGDYYFLYSPALDDLLITKSTWNSSDFHPYLSAWLKEHIEEIYVSEWMLAEIGERTVLLHACCSKGLYIGSVILLDPITEEILESVDYSSALVSFSAGNEEESSDSAPGGDAVVIRLAVSSSNAALRIQVSRDDALTGLTFLQKNAFLLAWIYLLLVPLLLALLNLLLIRPLNALHRATIQIQEGNSSYRLPDRPPIYYSVEFREIGTSFNRMMDSIQTLTIKNYEYQLESQRVELENLQLTIRPHFLQNTFGILYTLCQMGENKKLGQFILYLSDYFRYIYQGVHQLATFTSEYAIIRGYIEIARVQHPNGFEIRYELPDACDDVMVPPLLIHNFIENIMSHGLKHGSCVHILLKMTRMENMAVFEITDDGIGMSADAVAAINRGQGVQDKTRVHVGLANSWHRLDKIYHGSASMTVASKEGEGTFVTIRIPQQTKEEDHESADCK